MTSARLGIDIGGTRLKLGLVVDGAITDRATCDLQPLQRSPAGLVDAIFRLAEPFSAAADGLGVGVAGVVHAAAGTVLASPNLAWLDGFGLAAALAEKTALPTRIDNDVNCIGWGEACAGAGIGSAAIVCLAIGTGLGGAIVRNGALYRGKRGRAGELGHIPVAADGPPCRCGGRGCAEQFVSQTGLLRMARELGMSGLDDRDAVINLFAAARAGDRRARELVKRAGWALGAVIAWCCELLEPDRVIVTGGIAAALPELMPDVRASLRTNARAPLHNIPVIVSALGDDAGIIGASLLLDEPLAKTPVDTASRRP